ncbi:MAG: DUF1844 domain-containing protein [Alphaproteobacteria bacterium]|nr:DUF1844 domain-containing protein [Alphaproteobacteria bacterium]
MPQASPAATDLPVTFSSFLVSLGRTAIEHIGDPERADDRHDLAMAAQTIGLIAVLQEKTVGNLDDEEAKLTESVLYELRLRLERKRALLGEE